MRYCVGDVIETPPIPEQTEFNFDVTGHHLVIRMNDPMLYEVEAVKTGKIHFAIYEVDGVLFFLYAFGEKSRGIPVSDCSYSWHLVPREYQVAPPPEGSERLRVAILVTLVDAVSGILLAIRFVTFSPEFTLAIQNAIRRQIARPFSRKNHAEVVDRVYAENASSMDLWKKAQFKCNGGD